MTTRSVRLDDETEQALAALVGRTGASISTIFKRGVLALRERVVAAEARNPYEVYRALDLGPGGYAVAPARRSREGVRLAIRKRRAR